MNFDIHLTKDFKGKRYVERITECIPIEDVNDYTYEHRKEKTMEGKFEKFVDNTTKFFTKETNKELYKYVNILEYQDGKYIMSNKISNTNLEEMLLNMDDTDAKDFKQFVEKTWGEKLKIREEA